MTKFEITRPKGWRKGQMVFNFSHWLRYKHIDPFYLEDKEIEELFEKYFEETKKDFEW